MKELLPSSCATLCSVFQRGGAFSQDCFLSEIFVYFPTHTVDMLKIGQPWVLLPRGT